MAEEAGMEEEEVLEALEAADTSRPASLDAPVAAGEPDGGDGRRAASANRTRTSSRPSGG